MRKTHGARNCVTHWKRRVIERGGWDGDSDGEGAIRILRGDGDAGDLLGGNERTRTNELSTPVPPMPHARPPHSRAVAMTARRERSASPPTAPHINRVTANGSVMGQGASVVPPRPPEGPEKTANDTPDANTNETTPLPVTTLHSVDATLALVPTTPSAARTETRRRQTSMFSKRKGVRYRSDGGVLACRFCEILRCRDEVFLCEDDALVVFRPLRPIASSHILIVPRAHIRNIKMLAPQHLALLHHMRVVAARVLTSECLMDDTRSQCPRRAEQETRRAKQHENHGDHSEGPSPSLSYHRHQRPRTITPHTKRHVRDCQSAGNEDDDDASRGDDEGEREDTAAASECHFAFHVPPFNSVDHVHMHAFRGAPGYLGRVKYLTESWWCHSFEQVVGRLEEEAQRQQAVQTNHHVHPHAAAVPPPGTRAACLAVL